MRTPFIKFVKKLAIYTLIIVLLAYLVSLFIPAKYLSPAMPYLLVFFFLVAAFTYHLALNAMNKKTSRYANFFMISVFAKLLLYIAVILIYAFANTADIVGFIFIFFIYYLLFTVFETMEVIKVQKSPK